MRLAICSSGIFPLEVGGIQRHSRLLIETLARRHPGLDIEVLHAHVGQRLFAAFPRVREHHIAPRPGVRNYLLECYDLSARMAEVLRSMPDAIVYSQGMDVWAGIREFAPRLIVNPHGLESYQAITLRQKLIGVPYKAIHNHLFRHARCVVSLGGRLTTILRRHVADPARRIVVIPNGVLPCDAPRASQTRPNAACRVLFVARLVYNKGVPDVIQAFHLLHERGLSHLAQLTLVGEGPLRQAFDNDGLPPNVRFAGAVDDTALDELYRESDVFILPTLFEGMPTVVLEAMARGLPIIVTDVGATTELVDDANGMIIPIRDPAAIAAAIERFARLTPAERQSLGAQSLRKVADRFTWDRVADAHYALFSRLADEQKKMTVMAGYADGRAAGRG